MQTHKQQMIPLFRAERDATRREVVFEFDGEELTAPAGVSIAAALLINGVDYFRRTPVHSAPRAPYCMMGVCFDCLVQVDGVGNRQSCQIEVQGGMAVRRQQGAPALDLWLDGAEHGR